MNQFQKDFIDYIDNISYDSVAANVTFDPSLVGKLLGGGADGDVYSYGSRQVVKVMGSWDPRVIRRVMKCTEMRRYFVRIMGFGMMKNHKDDYDTIPWMIMERLQPLTPLETDVGYNLIEHVCCDEPLSGERSRIRSRFIRFFRKVREFGHHDDLHIGNVMKDRAGYFRVIDLDSFMFWGRGNPRPANIIDTYAVGAV